MPAKKEKKYPFVEIPRHRMEFVRVRIDDLIPFEGNPRHNNESAKMVAESIKVFGFLNPINITDTNIILTGHTRTKAMKLLGQEWIDAIRIHGLTDEEIAGYVIADNRVGEYSRWNYTAVDRMVAKTGNKNEMLKKLGMSSFKDNKDELEALIAGTEGSPIDADGHYVPPTEENTQADA